MELLEGETLRLRIQRQDGLSLSELKPIIKSVCAGLDAVHQHGVLHGDLKPANIFLPRNDGDQYIAAKLVDFGTSKVHGLERLTRTGEITGTPIYMAPELLTGNESIDERIDIYALGVLLYEALCGEIPFTERNPGKLIFQIAMGKGIPLKERGSFASPLLAVVERALAIKKDDRFATANELSRAFEAIEA